MKPNLLQKAWNFARASAEFIKEGMPVVPEEVYNKRMATCTSCPLLDETNTCNSCGCFMPKKSGWATAFCPEGKWDKYKVGGNGRKINLRKNEDGESNNTEVSNEV
jgi:hypothetical protein